MRSKVFVASVLVILVLGGCVSQQGTSTPVQRENVPFPPTWTPTAAVESTPTSTLVVVPTPTWDGTPPPPSEAYVLKLEPAQLSRMLQGAESLLVVDVRSVVAFEQAHIIEAIHIPLEELEDRLGELDGNKTVVFYCTSPNESMSLQAAMIVYKAGFTKVAVLNGGLQAWYSTGYPIDGELLTPTPGFLPLDTVTPMPTWTPEATATPTATTPVQPTETITPTATSES